MSLINEERAFRDRASDWHVHFGAQTSVTQRVFGIFVLFGVALQSSLPPPPPEEKVTEATKIITASTFIFL